MNEISPEPIQAPTTQKIGWHFWAKLFLGVVCLIGTISISAYLWIGAQLPAWLTAPEPNVNEEQTQTPQSIPTQFYSNKTNITFTIPAGWREVDPATVTNIVGFSNPQFMFLQEELGCIIAAGKFDMNAANYKQTSFGSRVSEEIFLFGGDWYTNQAYHKEPIIFSEDTRQYRAYELRTARDRNDVDLLLWQRDNASVPDVCNRDYESLLQTTQLHFSPFTLKDYDTGTLFLRTENPGTNMVETRLLYTDNEDKNTYEIVKLPPGTGHGGKVFIRNGALYALSELDDPEVQTAKSIVKIDPVQATVEELPLVTENEKVINHYVTPDTIYFMVASSSAHCMGYRESCQADLYAYDFNSNERKLLTSDITSAQLDGFDKTTGTLYLTRGWGDAGCMSNKIDTYQVNTGIITNIVSFSGCTEDPSYDAYLASTKALYSRFNEERSSGINYNIGSLIPSEQEVSDAYSAYIFVK